MSAKRMRQYRTASGKQIRKYALARKGKSARPFHSFGTWTPEMVLLIGHLIFDGEILKAKCSYNNRSEALLNRVEKLMREVYDYEPARYLNRFTGVRRIGYYNVAISNYLQKKAKQLLGRIRQLPIEMKREFVRAFFDDEGCMDFRPKTNHRKVRGYQKNVLILKLIQTLLQDFNITARVVAPNEVIIVGKENLVRFEKEINFSFSVCVNGNRTNSRWKKHFEKRQILRLAIESFKN